MVLATPRRPRENWEAAFEKMAAAGDDELLIPDDLSSDWDDAEWEWWRRSGQGSPRPGG